MKTTAAQISALRTILSTGGLYEEYLHMGRPRRGTINKRLGRRLVEMGLAEWTNTWVENNRGEPRQVVILNATAAGCLAVATADSK